MTARRVGCGMLAGIRGFPLVLLLAACAVDRDGDGVPASVDCDDHDAARGAAWIWHADADGDGHGDPAAITSGCAVAPGLSANGFDCDDHDASVHPAAIEVCGGRDMNCDGRIDDDCDGEVDEGAIDAITAWRDRDGDGYGDVTAIFNACEIPFS